ncbi:unnamed protein product, partial [Didymodactylos carnosus]
MTATGAYRFQYASVWDYRFNHIPLPRVDDEMGYSYVLGQFDVIPASRRGGWALEQGLMYGAPFDAA